MADTRITIDAQLQMRHDIEDNWKAVDPVLRPGEPAYTIGYDDRFKIGDGQRRWSELPYLTMYKGGAEGTPPGSLAELSDVKLGNLSNGQSLVYDEVSGKWVNREGADTEMSDTSENPVQNKVIKAYVDNAVEECAKLDDGYVVAKGIVNQDDVYYHLPNNAPENDADHTLATQGWVEGKGYLTSAAMTNYATKDDIKNFVKKGTTLAHYGITDAVYRSANFDATSVQPWVMGYSNASYGWKATGPAMLWGTNGYYTRLNVQMEALDSPSMYISNVYNNTEYGWAKLLTDKNIASYALPMKTFQSGIDLNEIEAGLYDLAGAITNSPSNYGSLLNIKGYFSAQLLFDVNGAAAYYRTKLDREVDGTKWRPWQTIITQSSGDDRYLKLSGGTLTGQLYVQNSAGDRYIHSKCDTAHIAFGVGSGGNNRGIFDINDGKWWIVRNNSDYTEIVSSTMSLVGKVNVTGVLEARSGITLGNVTRTSWPTEGIAKNSILLPNNAFDNFGKIQFSQLDNALYAAYERYTVDVSGFSSSEPNYHRRLFDGSYEGDYNKVLAGGTGVIMIGDGVNPIIKDGGYPYGDIVLSFYYTNIPESATVEVYSTYEPHGIGWHTLSRKEVRGSNGGVWIYNNLTYGITQLRITVNASATIDTNLVEIDWFLTRAVLSNLPVVTKFAIDQELWGKLICKGGITLGNRTITSWDDIKASGAYLPLTGGTLSGNLTVTGQVNASAFNLQTNLASVYFYTNIFTLNASLQINGGWVLRLNGEGITSWGDLKAILGLKSLAYKDSIAFSEITSKPTTLSGYGITDAYTRAQVDALIANVEGGSGSGTGNITIDSALSETSVNPVQNNVITANINRINASLTSVNTTLGSLRSLAYKEKVDWDTDIENIPDDLGGEIKVVSQTATSGTVGINPNVINKWGSLSSTDSFTIAFNDGEDGVANYYMLEFKMTATSPTITLPDSVVWANGYNVLENITSNRAATCQISILDGLAVGAIFYDE